MDGFAKAHQSQLDSLHIPDVLFPGLYRQLRTKVSGTSTSINSPSSRCDASAIEWTAAGALLVLPHVCEWDPQTNANDGLWNALKELSLETLDTIRKGLEDLDRAYADSTAETNNHDADQELPRTMQMNAILSHSLLWCNVVLFRRPSDGRVQAALLAPPYPRQLALSSVGDATTAAQLSGPFPFFFCPSTQQPTAIATSLAYWESQPTTPTNAPSIDWVPAYSCRSPQQQQSPNAWISLRAVRYAALLGRERALQRCGADCGSWLDQLWMGFCQQYPQRGNKHPTTRVVEQGPQPTSAAEEKSLEMLNVYTDTNDPMELAHPVAGLDSSRYQLVNDIEKADVVYSFQSLFGPQSPLSNRKSTRPQINQLPYEGAWVQKDHLARGILEQHGWPLPAWALESFDLDVHLGPFLAYAGRTNAQQQQQQQQQRSLWIVKPARGTQSKGHVITDNLGEILKLVDASGGVVSNRVAQRYIRNPVTYQGRKVDCRILVVVKANNNNNMEESSLSWQYMLHKRVYFRIAHKIHRVHDPNDMKDPCVVLTATHLFSEQLHHGNDGETAANQEDIRTLPVDSKTIAYLEETCPGFQWDNDIFPKLQVMVKQLFDGMTEAYAEQLLASVSFAGQALYGVDVMFEMETPSTDSDDDAIPQIQPKLTEVTFCPANNSICDAYERDDELYESYNTELFDCLFRGIVSDNWVVL